MNRTPLPIVLAIVLFLLSGCAVAREAPTAKAGSTAWRLGEPIVTYWAGPGSHNVLDDTACAQLAAGGWNLAWTESAEMLDTAHRHGLRALHSIGPRDLDDPKWRQWVDQRIAEARNHPAMYAYYLQDEPTPEAFAHLARLKTYLAEHDPHHPIWVNLYPTYANSGQLGTDGDTVTAYREHLRQFMATIDPPILSYDHYHFKVAGDGNQYFLNLAMIRDTAVAYGRPFVNVVQAVSWRPAWREPGEGERRFLTYTTLAYGGQGICHYVYNFKNVRSGFFNQQDADRTLPSYWQTSRLNRDFVAIGTELQPLTSLGAYHLGDIPMGGQALPAGSPFTIDPAPPTRAYDNPDWSLRNEKPIEGMLLGYFGRSDRPTHVLVVNLDYQHAVTTSLVGSGPLQVFHAPTRTWRGNSGTDSRVKLELPPGGGALVRLVAIARR
jgi:hypothetical protein